MSEERVEKIEYLLLENENVLLFWGSAREIRDSTQSIVSRVTSNSPSENIFVALSEYRNSISRGAKLWI